MTTIFTTLMSCWKYHASHPVARSNFSLSFAAKLTILTISISLSYEPLYSVICQSNDHIIVRGFMGHPPVNTMHLEWRSMVQQKYICTKKCPA